MGHVNTPTKKSFIPRVGAVAAACALAATAFAPTAFAQDAKPSGEANGADVQLRAPGTLKDLTQLPSDENILQPGPKSGHKVPGGPFKGQVLPGFGGLVANEDGTYYGLPDNGFRTKADSADFLLRIYQIQPNWYSEVGGEAKFDVLGHISLSDPDCKLPFKIKNEFTKDRLLTGADLDPESFQRAADGSFWVGEEYGPWLLHFSPEGKLLEAPYSNGLTSPENPVSGPYDKQVVQSSGGFESLAKSKSGRYLFPILEKARTDEPNQRIREIYEFDTIGKDGQGPGYTGRVWKYQVGAEDNRISDAQFDTNGRLLVIERDNKDGNDTRFNRIYSVSLRGELNEAGALQKRFETDLLRLRNSDRIGEYGGNGQGNPYAWRVKEPAALVVLPGGDMVVANDTNYPFDDAIFSGEEKDPITILKISR